MIYLASDHAGYPLKQHIAAYLSAKGQAYTDLGTNSTEPCNYTVFGRKTAETIVAGGENDLGLLFCGTGAGISMAANRVKGARCVNCSEPATARLARSHNNANLLAIGSRIVGRELAQDIVNTFLTTPFSGEERHLKRIEEIECACREEREKT